MFANVYSNCLLYSPFVILKLIFSLSSAIIIAINGLSLLIYSLYYVLFYFEMFCQPWYLVLCKDLVARSTSDSYTHFCLSTKRISKVKLAY